VVKQRRGGEGKEVHHHFSERQGFFRIPCKGWIWRSNCRQSGGERGHSQTLTTKSLKGGHQTKQRKGKGKIIQSSMKKGGKRTNGEVYYLWGDKKANSHRKERRGEKGVFFFLGGGKKGREAFRSCRRKYGLAMRVRNKRKKKGKDVIFCPPPGKGKKGKKRRDRHVFLWPERGTERGVKRSSAGNRGGGKKNALLLTLFWEIKGGGE